jgi:hypothetical protein
MAAGLIPSGRVPGRERELFAEHEPDQHFEYPQSISADERQRRQLDLVRKLNEIHQKDLQNDVQLEARIEAFEIAFRMQTEATDAFDITKEPDEIKALYGNGDLGSKLLVARRLVERGVRFVQVNAGGWDHHGALELRCAVRRQPDVPAPRRLKTPRAARSPDSTLVSGVANSRTVTKDQRKCRHPDGITMVAMVAWTGGRRVGGTV